MGPAFQPDRLVINGTSVITGHVYPLRPEEAFYDSDRTVLNPTELLTHKKNRPLLKVQAEIEHTHNNGVELEPHMLYYVAAINRRWETGGPVADTDCCVVLLSENREANS